MYEIIFHENGNIIASTKTNLEGCIPSIDEYIKFNGTSYKVEDVGREFTENSVTIYVACYESRTDVFTLGKSGSGIITI